MADASTLSQTRSLPPHNRALCWLAGADPRRVAGCPREDLLQIQLAGLSLLASFLALSFLVTVVLGIALDAGLALRVPVAALVAGAVVLFDKTVTLSRLYAEGYRQLDARGFSASPIGTSSRTLKRGLVAAFRVSLSLSLAVPLAGFYDTVFWEKDILRQMQADHQSQNAAIRAEAKRALEAEKAALDHQIARKSTEAADLADADRLAGTSAAEQFRTRTQQQSQELAQLRALEAELDVSARCFRMNVTAEEFGQTDCDGRKAVKGKSDRYAANLALSQQTEADLAGIRTRKADLETRLSQAVAPLPVVSPQRAGIEAELTRLRTARDRIEAESGALIEARMQVDPGFVPEADGLILRQQAFARLLQDQPFVALMAFLIAVFLIFVEMAGVLSSLLTSAPSLLALRMALDFELAAQGEIAIAEERLAEVRARAEAARDRQGAAREQADVAARRRDMAARVRAMTDAALGEAAAAADPVA